jgi:hypothetical protein
MLHPGARTLKAADGDFRFCPARTCDELCGKGEAAECLEALAVRMTEQGMIIRFDGPVAFADRLPHSLKIGDLNFTSRVFDQPSLLKSMCVQCDTSAPDPEHLGKKFLGKFERIAVGQISGAE